MRNESYIQSLARAASEKWIARQVQRGRRLRDTGAAEIFTAGFLAGRMTDPDVQYFPRSGQWVKPEGAERVDIVLQGGQGPDAGRTTASIGRRIDPNGYQCSNGEPGGITVSSFHAGQVDDLIEVTVGRSGGHPRWRDGYALIITHLEAS